MKVKNIAFSGFAAAILMAVSGAAQAAEVSPVRLASQGYVDTQVGYKQDKLTQADNAGTGVLISNTGVISVDTAAVAESEAIQSAITTQISSGEAFNEAVSGAIDGALDPETGVIAEKITQAVNAATSGKADQTDVDALNEQINKEGTGLAAQIAAAASAASAAQGTADDAVDAAAAAQEAADDAAAAAAANAENIATNTSDIAALKAIDHSKYATTENVAATYATNTTVNALADVVGTKADASALDSLATKQSVTELTATVSQNAQTAETGIQEAKDAASAADGKAVAAQTDATQALADAAAAAEAAEAAQGTANTAVTNAANAQAAAEAADTKAGQAATAATNAQAKADSAYTLADAAQTAEEVQSAINTKLATENYMSGNNIGAGSYLMMSDGEGGISWSSVVIVDENGADIVLPSDAPKL